MLKKEFTLWDIGSAIALFGLLSTGMWAELDTLGAPAWITALGLFGFSKLLLRGQSPRFRFSFELDRRDVFVALGLLLPLIIVTVLGWNSEFPFSGDHDHHLLAAHAAEAFWLSNWYFLISFTVLISGGFLFLRSAFWPVVVFLFMVAASFFAEVPHEYFARYPATTYLFTLPFNLIVEWTHANSYWNASRFVNLLAPVVWLFVLRPMVFGRRASFGWLIPAVFLLFQRESLFYIDSVYLEAWAMICLLMAMEALLDAEAAVEIAPLFAGLACAFKESAAIPFLILGGAALVRTRFQWNQMRRVLAAGSLSIIPFAVYYLERRASGVWRTLELTSFSESFTPERLELFDFRLQEQFTAIGITALGLVVGIAIGFAFLRRDLRWTALLVCFGGAAQFVLFFIDKISRPYTGYPRLLLMPWLMVLAPAYLLPRKFALIATSVLLLGSVPALIHFGEDLVGPDYAKDFTEDYGSAFYYPIRRLIEKGQLQPGQTVRWIPSSLAAHPMVLPLAYCDLFERYRWEAFPATVDSAQCRCLPGVALLITTAHSRNLNLRSPSAPYPADINVIRPECLEEAAKTCQCIHEGEPSEGQLCVWH